MGEKGEQLRILEKTEMFIISRVMDRAVQLSKSGQQFVDMVM